MKKLPLNDEIVVSMSQMVDDSGISIPTRKPSHADIDSIVSRYKLEQGDPKFYGQSVGKAKRINAVLNWSLEYDQEAGESFLGALIAAIRGYGGFREKSPNFVGNEAIKNLQNSFKNEGLLLISDGSINPIVLEALSDFQLEDALERYIRRAKKGASDAALLTGTSKDLLEAVSAHVIHKIIGKYQQSNFPTLLGFAFHLLEMSTPDTKGKFENKTSATERLEISLYELGCAVNNLRNKEGTGHGRPFLPNVSSVEAKAAIESMGMISEILLSKLKEKDNLLIS